MDRSLATHRARRCQRGEAIEVHTFGRAVLLHLGFNGSHQCHSDQSDCLFCLGAISSLYEPEVIESDKRWSVRLPPYRARHHSANVNAAK